MPRICTVCAHSDRTDIERRLVSGDAVRPLAAEFGVSSAALQRHRRDHLAPRLLAAKEAEDIAGASEVIRDLKRITERAYLLYDACDRYLRDADDPTRYDIGPREHEITVTYYEAGDDDDRRRKPRKELLSSLLDRLEQKHGIGIVRESIRIADPRDLIVKTMVALRGNLELLSKLTGELDERPQVNVLVSPEWAELRATLFAALQPYPEARTAVAGHLRLLQGGKDAV